MLLLIFFFFVLWKFVFVGLGVDLFEFFLSWNSVSIWDMYILMSFIKLGKFPAIFQKLCLPYFPLFSPWIPTVYMLVHLMYLRSLTLCSLSFYLFSFCSSDCIISTVLSSSSLILLRTWICLWIPVVKFSLQLLYISAAELAFGFFLSFLFNWYFVFFCTLLSWLFPHLLLILWESL